jgi:hypothetical protein
MSTKTFIDQLAAGHAADAKETLSDLLSARAFEALDARKQELGATLFGGQVEEEVEDLEEAFPDASGKEVLGYDEYKARMKKLSDRQLKYHQKKHEREYGPDTGKRGPTGSITHYSVNQKGKLVKIK